MTRTKGKRQGGFRRKKPKVSGLPRQSVPEDLDMTGPADIVYTACPSRANVKESDGSMHILRTPLATGSPKGHFTTIIMVLCALENKVLISC